MPAHLQCPPELLLKAQGMRAVIFDVDGVMTDGGLYLSADGEPVKRFHVLDGHGLRLLQQVGLVPVVITGRDSKALRARLLSLGVHHACYGVQDKAAALIKSLPKILRRNFVPAPDFARAFAEAFPLPDADSIEGTLARFLKKLTGVDVSAVDFNPASVDAHLRG